MLAWILLRNLSLVRSVRVSRHAFQAIFVKFTAKLYGCQLCSFYFLILLTTSLLPEYRLMLISSINHLSAIGCSPVRK